MRLLSGPHRGIALLTGSLGPLLTLSSALAAEAAEVRRKETPQVKLSMSCPGLWVAVALLLVPASLLWVKGRWSVWGRSACPVLLCGHGCGHEQAGGCVDHGTGFS